MHKAALSLLLLCVQHSSAAILKSHREGHLRRSHLNRSMLSLYPFYHSTEAIHDELLALASKCPGMSMESRQLAVDDDHWKGYSIDVVTIKAPDATPVNKNFFLFGEHARELISPESGLHFVKTLCGETGSKERAAAILRDSEFKIVVNGNPASRKRVEQGDFCLRVNPDGVDLNRNWAEEWQSETVFDSVDTNPGPRPFSEPETQIFKDLVTEYKPTNFLTVHSGTKGMYMPWAYDMEHLAQRNQPSMMHILRTLDKNHCECPFGAAGREVGYSCPGTCLDWVYDKLQTPYAFAFEIYTDPIMDDELKERWQEKMESGLGAFYQQSSHLGHDHFHDVFENCPSDFVQLKSETKHLGMSQAQCFANFNPNSKDLYGNTVENWSNAYLDMAELVVKSLRESSSA